MNHKRTKSKRSVRCTLCTKYTWLGNHKERHDRKYRNHRVENIEDEKGENY
jgi:hypothetical protein